MSDETEKVAPDLPASHAHTNRKGMTNGVPDQADAGDSTGLPHDERQDSETAASDKGSGS